MHESKFIQIIFFISPLFYFQTKHREGKLKTILSSHFLPSSYFLSSHFSTPPTKFSIATQVPRTWVPCAGRAKVEKLSMWTSSLKTTKNNPNRNHKVSNSQRNEDQTHKETKIKPTKKKQQTQTEITNHEDQTHKETKIKPTKKKQQTHIDHNEEETTKAPERSNHEDQTQTTKIKSKPQRSNSISHF